MGEESQLLGCFYRRLAECKQLEKNLRNAKSVTAEQKARLQALDEEFGGEEAFNAYIRDRVMALNMFNANGGANGRIRKVNDFLQRKITVMQEIMANPAAA